MANGKFPQAQYDFYKSNGSNDHVVFNREPSLTRQEFAEECDINSLMKRYEGHGQTINQLMRQPAEGGMYIDFAELPQDLMGYMKFMDEAKAAFMTLPAIVRKEFENDPIQFVDFASDPANLEQMREWDLAPPAAKEVPEAAPVAPSEPVAAPHQAPTAPGAAPKKP